MIEKGLTNRFLEVGKIKIGGKGKKLKSKAGNDYRAPVRFEHFVITTTEKDENENFKRDEQIHKLIGAEPKELSIRLPFDDIDMNFYTTFALYESRKNKCHGNGISATWTTDKGEKKQVPCNQDCKHLKDGKCKPSGILSCHISQSYNVGGIYRLRTHSWNTVSAILAALKYFKENIPGGILQGIPFKLVFMKKNTAEHGNVPVITLVGDGKVMLEDMRQLGATEMHNREQMGLVPGYTEKKAIEIGYKPEGDDKPNDIQDEFYTTEIEIEKEPGYSSDDVKDKIQNKEPEKEIKTLPGIEQDEKKKGKPVF